MSRYLESERRSPLAAAFNLYDDELGIGGGDLRYIDDGEAGSTSGESTR